MRTTLTIDDDVLEAARERAEMEHKTIGEVLSALARKGLQPAPSPLLMKNGVPQLPVQPGSRPVTIEFINRLRDELV